MDWETAKNMMIEHLKTELKETLGCTCNPEIEVIQDTKLEPPEDVIVKAEANSIEVQIGTASVAVTHEENCEYANMSRTYFQAKLN